MAVFPSRQISLPKRINFVDYIQSDGAQYIDTGVVGKAGISVKCEFEIISNSLSNFAFIGSATNNWAVRCYPIAGKNSCWRYGYIAGYEATTGPSLNTKYLVETDLSKGEQSMKVNSQQVLSTQNTNSMDTGLTMFVFCSNYKGSTEALASYKLYHLEIYDNGALVRDYWPCLDPEGVACLYDKVNDEYVYNAGTGTFTAG